MKKLKMIKKKFSLLGGWLAVVALIYLYLFNHGKASGYNPSLGAVHNV
ncbi:hypothetical protein ACIJEF_002476 [Enterococcus faecalis]